jgi:hypothetical protein
MAKIAVRHARSGHAPAGIGTLYRAVPGWHGRVSDWKSGIEVSEAARAGYQMMSKRRPAARRLVYSGGWSP